MEAQTGRRSGDTRFSTLPEHRVRATERAERKILADSDEYLPIARAVEFAEVDPLPCSKD